MEKTVVDFEIEKAAKDARDLERATNEALAEFERRSGERKEQFDEINGRLQEAKSNLDANKGDVQRLQGIINNPDSTADEKSAAELELNGPNGNDGVASETDGL